MLEKKLLLQKIDKVVEKLENLEVPFAKEKFENKETVKQGFFIRDFGIDVWDWPQGVGLYGLNKLQTYLGEAKYENFLNSWFTKHFKEGLPLKNVNTSIPMLTLIELANKNPEYEKACHEWAEYIMNQFPRTQEGGLQHVTSAITFATNNQNGLTLNEDQVWIDTLFMVILFLTKMGVKYNRQDYIDEAIYQVLIHIKYLCEKRNALMYHAWTFVENNNFGGIFWGRGNCWFSQVVVDMLDTLKDRIDNSSKTLILNTYRRQIDALCKLQHSSGGWHTILDDSTSYLEVSATCGFASAILKGIRLGYLDRSYQDKALKAIDFIMKNIDDDGLVHNVSAGTGPGNNAEHYKNIVISPMAYGQSLAIIAISEALYISK